MASTAASRPRLVVIGLDGADWSIIDPLLERGDLPHLRRLIDAGCRGELQSTFPPHTPCAWSTIFTGVNPGKHGIFTFHTIIPGTYTWRLTRSSDRKVRALWEIANESGLTVGAINIPMTWPAERIDGYMISGMIGAPAVTPSAFWPREIAEEVHRLVPDLSMEVVARRNGHYAVDEMRRVMERRLALVRALLTDRPTDVFIAVLTYTDAVQHHWLADPSVPLAGADEVLRDTYRRVDALLGEILDVVGDETNILILSDHGSGPVNLYLNLPRLLEDLGLIERVSDVSFFLTRVRRRLRRLFRPAGGEPRGIVSPISHELRWERSRVYSMITHVSLRLNLAGREPRGVIPAEREHEELTEIARMLREVQTPKAEWARLEVRTRDELFHGEWAHLMPDLCAMVTAGGQMLTLPPRPYLRSQPAFLTPREAVALDPDLVRGTHRLQGVLLGAGPAFRAGAEVSGATLQDITPTLLQVLGLPVPAYMDGRPLTEMLRDAGAVSVASEADARRDESGEQGYSEEEAALVEKRLRDLGYM